MTLADTAAAQGLHRVGGRPPLRSYLAEVWRRREFVYALAKYRIEAENGRNRLGMAWVVLKPLMNAAVFAVVFGFLLRTHRGVDDYLAFLVIGVMMFEFFSTCLTTGARSITANAALVQSLSFPRMSLPLSLVTQKLLNFIPMVGIMMLVALCLGNWPRWEWLLFIPLTVIFTIFNTGVTLFTARLTVHFRDLTQLLPFVSRFFLYATGVFFSLEQRFAEHTTFLSIIDWQPIHEFLTLARAILLDGPDYQVRPEYFALATGWALFMILLGTVFFWAAEERYGRVD